MGQQYLMDSNAVIDYLSGQFSKEGMSFMIKVVNNIPMISVITKIEVLGYKTNPDASVFLRSFIEDSIVFGLSDSIVEQTIELRKQMKIKTPDAIIAATALVKELTLITRNTKDFDNIEKLKVFNPFKI